MDKQDRREIILGSLIITNKIINNLCSTYTEKGKSLRSLNQINNLSDSDKISLCLEIESSLANYVKEQFANKKDALIPKIGYFKITQFKIDKQALLEKNLGRAEYIEQIKKLKKKAYLDKIEKYTKRQEEKKIKRDNQWKKL